MHGKKSLMEKLFKLKKGGRTKSADVKSGKKPSIAEIIGMKKKKKKSGY